MRDDEAHYIDAHQQIYNNTDNLNLNSNNYQTHIHTIHTIKHYQFVGYVTEI